MKPFRGIPLTNDQRRLVAELIRHKRSRWTIDAREGIVDLINRPHPASYGRAYALRLWRLAR